MLIDYTYFFGDCEVGQLDQQAVQDKLNLFIAEYEPKFLGGLLGYDTYTQFKAGLLITPTIPQIWVDLRDGAEYTGTDGFLKRWPGLLQPATTPMVPKSPIAYYVYYWYQRALQTNSSGTGESKPASENAMPAGPGQKMVTAWNKMVELNIQLYDFLYIKKDTYPAGWLNWSSQRWYGNWAYGGFQQNTPYQFLTKINTFGI